jgi:hypothetical protein
MRLWPPDSGMTCICVPMRSLSAATCDITPISLPLLQSRKGLQGCFERVFVEGSESFIEKERIDSYISAGHVREAERQGEADDEAFAAGEIFRGTDLTRLVVVDDIEFQRLG